MNGISVLLLPLLLFCGSFILTKIICFYSIEKQWFDVPDSRSSHVIPTPKSGGLAFSVVFLGAVIYLYLNNSSDNSLAQNEFLALLIGGGVAILGFLDDLINLSIKVRIGTHCLAVVSALFLLGGPPDIPFLNTVLQFDVQWLHIVGYIIISLGFVWLINFYNFMDGIDALAALEAIFVSLAASVLIWMSGVEFEAFVLLCLGVSVAGFLVLNVPPAKIFMGDAGSNFLGFILGVLGIITIHNGLLDIWTWGILLGVFVVDSTVTLLSRMRSGEAWYYAHSSHAYQQAAKKYTSHAKVDLGITLINIFWLFPLAWFNTKFHGWGIIILVIAYLPLLILVRKFRQK